MKPPIFQEAPFSLEAPKAKPGFQEKVEGEPDDKKLGKNWASLDRLVLCFKNSHYLGALRILTPPMERPCKRDTPEPSKSCFWHPMTSQGFSPVSPYLYPKPGNDPSREYKFKGPGLNLEKPPWILVGIMMNNSRGRFNGFWLPGQTDPQNWFWWSFFRDGASFGTFQVCQDVPDNEGSKTKQQDVAWTCLDLFPWTSEYLLNISQILNSSWQHVEIQRNPKKLLEHFTKIHESFLVNDNWKIHESYQKTGEDSVSTVAVS